MIKAVIVEDEKHSVLNLKSLLKKYKPEVEVVAVFESGREALEKLPNISFDLLFLDIQYNDDFDAFELLKAWRFEELNIIFVTSYNQYAIKAFKFNAIDYITKPIDKDDLIESIERAKTKIFKKKELNDLLKTVQAFSNEQLAFRTQNETHFISIKRILYFQANKEYSTVYFLDDHGKIDSLLLSKNIGFWEKEVHEFPFVRVHKSSLVNMEHVSSIGQRIKLTDGTKLDMARDRKKDIQTQITNYKKGL